MLLTVNVLPMLLMLALVARWAERFGTTDWGRIFVVAAAALGTLLTPFAVVLNNHTDRGGRARRSRPMRFCESGSTATGGVRWFALAGGFAAFAAADELPALSLLALLAAALLLRDLAGVAAGVRAGGGRRRRRVLRARTTPPTRVGGRRTCIAATTDDDDNWYDYTYTLGRQERHELLARPAGTSTAASRAS